MTNFNSSWNKCQNTVLQIPGSFQKHVKGHIISQILSWFNTLSKITFPGLTANCHPVQLFMLPLTCIKMNSSNGSQMQKFERNCRKKRINCILPASSETSLLHFRRNLDMVNSTVIRTRFSAKRTSNCFRWYHSLYLYFIKLYSLCSF